MGILLYITFKWAFSCALYLFIHNHYVKGKTGVAIDCPMSRNTIKAVPKWQLSQLSFSFHLSSARVGGFFLNACWSNPRLLMVHPYLPPSISHIIGCRNSSLGIPQCLMVFIPLKTHQLIHNLYPIFRSKCRSLLVSQWVSTQHLQLQDWTGGWQDRWSVKDHSKFAGIFEGVSSSIIRFKVLFKRF